MKKLLCVICVLLTVTMLSGMTATAQPAEDDDVYAVATIESGRKVMLADVPDVQTIERLDGYELIIEEKPVLTVEQSQTPMLTADIQPDGYFSAEFALPDTTKTVYLVGLSADKVAEIQQRIIAGYAQGADFELEDLSFIDAEKTGKQYNNGDSLMCWAATASNILTYTGWAAKADQGFETADDVFEAFVNAFTDSGGSTFYGVGWFFNGVNLFALQDPNAASATAGTGGYLNDYAFDKVSGDVSIETDPVGGMRSLHEHLRAGCGIGLGLTIYTRGSYAGGHGDTCWGYVADTAYPDTDPRYYAGLFITDSDSDKTFSDRRSAPNVLQAVSLSTGVDSNGVMTYEFDIDDQNHAVIGEFTYLLPYSDTIETETASDATRDKIETFDIALNGAYLGTDMSSGTAYNYRKEKIETGTTFFYTPAFQNLSDTSFSGTVAVRIDFTDNATGRTAFTRSFNGSLSFGPGYGLSYGKGLKRDGGLPKGDYTVTMSLNDDHAVTEAFYYNNTYTFTLKVRDSYLLGDVNNNAEVDIMDATAIQRYIAAYGTLDDEAVQRGSIWGTVLDILDATAVQRFCAKYDDGNAVGEKQLYD